MSGALITHAATLAADRVHHVPEWDGAPTLVAELAVATARPAVVVTMGAGDVTEVGPRVLSLLEKWGGGSDDGTAI